MDIGKKIKSARETRGFGVNQLAKLAGVSGATITRWEKGQRQPRLSELVRVLDVLKLSFDELNNNCNADTLNPANEPAMGNADENDIRLVLNNFPALSRNEVDFIMNIVESKRKDGFVQE